MVKSIDSISREDLENEFLRMRKEMLAEIAALRSKVNDLNEHIKEQENEINDLKFENLVLKEKYNAMIIAKYQSQKAPLMDMPTLFDDAEMEAMKVEHEMVETKDVEGYTRKVSPKKEREIDYSYLEHRIETLEASAEDKICDVCGSTMQLKKYDEREELVVIPAQCYVRIVRTPVYECVECQSKNPEGKSSYKRIVKENPLFKRSMASAETLAYILDQKFNYGLPLYAIEKGFLRMNVLIPRQNMANWIINARKYFQPIFNLMKEDLLSQPVIHCDETTTQVLNEEGKLAMSTSYMFVYHSTEGIKPIVLYDYQASRSGEAPKKFLEHANCIYLLTDAYDGYNKVLGVIRAYCHVHALRKFKEAYALLDKKARKSNETLEAQAIQKYQNIFHLNDEIIEQANKLGYEGDIRYEYIKNQRQEKVKPALDEFFLWVKDMNTVGKDTLTKAKNYLINQEEGLYQFLNFGMLPMGNNITERSIRPFTVNRNRCKFYVSTKGADASALAYSIAITCIENKISPYGYFLHILKKLPNMDLNDKEELRKLLPYSSELPDYLRLMSPYEAKQKVRELAKELD